MGHNYGVPLRFLSVTPTRDNEAAPGNRLADKHSRLFHGKTLDEWLMIQLWSSRYCGKAIFVCETWEHSERLQPMADKYNVELIIRPKDMLHPINDSGSIPIWYAANRALYQDYYSLITSPFVVSPCRPPGFFDMMVEQYLKLIVNNPDYERGQAMVVGAYEPDGALFEIDDKHTGKQQGTVYLNKNPVLRFSTTSHWMAATWWWTSNYHIGTSRHDFKMKPKLFDIEPWQDIHIDTQDNWDWAEYWFGKKILSQGEDCYERYRATWAK
jgi:hypothetical protein